MTRIRGSLVVSVIGYRCYIGLYRIHCAKVKGVIQSVGPVVCVTDSAAGCIIPSGSIRSEMANSFLVASFWEPINLHHHSS